MRLILAALFVIVGIPALLGAVDAAGLLEGHPWLGVIAFLVVVTIAWWIFRVRPEHSSVEGQVRELRRAVAGGARLVPDPELDFRFEFVSTHGDLLDGERAVRRERTGMRGWVRGLVILMGLAWLGGFAAVVTLEHGTKLGVAPVAWLLLGSFVVWTFVVRPLRARRAIERDNVAAQPLVLHFTPRFVEVEAAGVGKLRRRWARVEASCSTRKGIVFVFDDTLSWLPARVFASETERARFEAKVATRLAQERLRVATPPTDHPILPDASSCVIETVGPEPDEDDPERFLDVTLRRGETRRRLRFVRVDAAVNHEALARTPTAVALLALPHPELDGLSVLAVDLERAGHLLLVAEDVVDLDASPVER